jgi:hypothetical protein
MVITEKDWEEAGKRGQGYCYKIRIRKIIRRLKI